MDEVDVVTRNEEVLMRARIEQARAKQDGPKATGFCLWCEEPLPEGQRFCDAECRHFYERSIINGTDKRRASGK